MKITVGLCVKNMPDTLTYTIQSLLKQTIAGDSEIFFVTPDLKDPSRGVFKENLDALTDKYAMVSQAFDKGQGLACARRIVVENAHSPYVAWVDGDHYIPPKFLERCYEFMENNPACGACNNIHLWIGSKPHQILEGMAWMYYTLKTAGHELRRVGSAGGCYRVEAVKQAGNYDPRFRIAAEDGYITYRMWKNGWKLMIDTENYYYHIIRGSIGEIIKEYRGWGSGSSLETLVNTGRRLDSRLLKFALSPIAGLKHGISYRRFVRSEIYRKFMDKASRDGVLLPDRIPLTTALMNVPFYTLKRYAWIAGYVFG
ncbi:MAG: glycosyltransferase family A protein [Candidatus Caldarchaeum sp.]